MSAARASLDATHMFIDEMYAITRTEMEAELRAGLPPDTPTYWLVVSDAAGVTRSMIDAPEDAETTPMRDAYVRDSEIDGIATVSFVQPHGHPQLVVTVLVRKPLDSGVRSAFVTEPAVGCVHIGPWQDPIAQ